jgi:ABC-type uncharacterized transport system substrate-binding protein
MESERAGGTCGKARGFMKRKAGLRVVLAVLFLIGAAQAFAHPHVFITNKMWAVFEGSALARIDFEWTFDESFSNMIISDYDKGKKGTFDAKEAAALKIGAFDNLRNYHYFIALRLDGRPLALPPIANFRPSISGLNLVYRFSLPVNLALKAGTPSTLGVVIYDDTYYVAFDRMSVSDVVVEPSATVDCAVSIEKTTAKAVWPGQFMPDQVVFRMRGP